MSKKNKLTDKICNDMLTKGITFIDKDLNFNEKIRIQRLIIYGLNINCAIIETPIRTIIKRV